MLTGYQWDFFWQQNFCQYNVLAIKKWQDPMDFKNCSGFVTPPVIWNNCCPKHKGRKDNGSNGGNTSNGGSNKRCNFCGIKRHKEAKCFKKNSDKASAWWKENQAKVKSATSNVEICLTSLVNIEGDGCDNSYSNMKVVTFVTYHSM